MLCPDVLVNIVLPLGGSVAVQALEPLGLGALILYVADQAVFIGKLHGAILVQASVLVANFLPHSRELAIFAL